MSLPKNNTNYSKTAKLFHWGFVFLFFYGVAKQVESIDQLENIFALIFFILLLIRFIYMKRTQKTALPKDTPKIQKLIAKILHNGMYILLSGTVLSGLLIGLLFWLGIKSGNLIQLIIIIHELITNLLYFLIGIHIAAATYHRFKKDGVWNAMVPFLKEKKN